MIKVTIEFEAPPLIEIELDMDPEEFEALDGNDLDDVFDMYVSDGPQWYVANVERL